MLTKWHGSRIVPAMLLGILMGAAEPAEAVSCLLFPLACVVPHRKYGEETQGLIIGIRNQRTIYRYTDGAPIHFWDDVNVHSPSDSHEQFAVWFRSGQTLYQAWVYYTVVGMATGYHPRREEWVGKTVKLRFGDKKIVGVNTPAVQFKRPDGKEWELGIISIVGPDGIDECKHYFCPLQAKVDRAAREAEQLARLQKAGQRSATDIAPESTTAPVDAPAGDAAAPAPAGEAAAPSAPAAADQDAAPVPAVPPAEGG